MSYTDSVETLIKLSESITVFFNTIEMYCRLQSAFSAMLQTH